MALYFNDLKPDKSNDTLAYSWSHEHRAAYRNILQHSLELYDYSEVLESKLDSWGFSTIKSLLPGYLNSNIFGFSKFRLRNQIDRPYTYNHYASDPLVWILSLYLTDLSCGIIQNPSAIRELRSTWMKIYG